MISSIVKSAFKVEKLHLIPRIIELAMHGSHEIQEKIKRMNFSQERSSIGVCQ